MQSDARKDTFTCRSTKSAFYLSPTEVQETVTETGLDERKLLLKLLEPASHLARPPLSQFYVGATALGKSGAIYIGVNLEFPGVPLYNTVHAEQFLVVNALLRGETELLYVATTAPPCGHCRQFLSELHNAESLRMLTNEESWNDCLLSEILPRRFRPQDVLGESYTSGLMAQLQIRPLEWTIQAREDLASNASNSLLGEAAERALRQASKSYVPYTKCPSAVAIVTDEGEIFEGGTIESCAYNPTMQPLQAAIIRAVSLDRLKSNSQIAWVVVVELEGVQKVSMADATALTLKAISPDARCILLPVKKQNGTEYQTTVGLIRAETYNPKQGENQTSFT